MSRTAAILLAAGSGRRMQSVVADKVLAPLGGRPVFAHSAAAFITSGIADYYVVVYRDQRQMMELSAYAPTPSVLEPVTPASSGRASRARPPSTAAPRRRPHRP